MLLGDVQSAKRLHHRLHPVPVGRDRQHPERLPSEMLLVLFPRMRGEIGAHFPLEARLQKIGAGDGHRAAVDLDHKGMAGAVRELESEDEVGDEADSCTAPWCESFTRSDNGLRAARVCSGKAAMMSLGWMNCTSRRAPVASCSATEKSTISN